MLFLLLACSSPPPAPAPPAHPKLVVLVVLDQFSTFLAESTQPQWTGGLKTVSSAWHGTGHYPTACTWTGPGHATLSTGALPADHGIAANRWIKENPEKPGEPLVVSAGKREQLQVSTVAEQVLSAQGTVLTFAAKERAAVLLAGRDPQAHAYWVRPQENALELGWRTDAKEGLPPWLPAPAPIPSAHLPAELLRSPQLAAVLTDAAIASLDQGGFKESPGPDFLAISYSEVDLTAHYFSADSPEAREAVLEVDRQLQRLLTRLEERLPGQWALLLTADHGGLPSPNLWMDEEEMERASSQALQAAGIQATVRVEEPGIWILGDSSVKSREVVAAAVRPLPGVASVLDNRQPIPSEQPWREQIQNCQVHPKEGQDQRSPDLFVLPHWGVAWRDPEQIKVVDRHRLDFGTQHGSPYDYDARVPVWAMGPGIPSGGDENVDMRRIAPTLASLLGVPPPSGASLPPLWTLP